MTRILKLLLSSCGLLFTLHAYASPVISEFSAGNDLILLDGHTNASDWIEIFNPDPIAIDLAGWFLTDTTNDLEKWTFPSVILAPGDFLIVFASGQADPGHVDPAGYFHTTFKLSLGGEYLALTMPDGTNIVSDFSPTYPPQFNDVSYGLVWQPGSGDTNLIEGASVQALVPTNGSLGTLWTLPGFTPDGSWTGGTGPGVGYDLDPPGASSNLVAAWGFNDAPGAGMIGDDSGQGYNGTPNGGVTLAGTGANANTLTSAGFNNGGIDVPHDLALNPSNFTFATWVRVSSAGSGYRSVVTSRMDNGVMVSGYILYVTPANIWSFWTGAGGPPGSWNVLNGPAVVLDTWLHLAISWDAATSTKSLYINGSVAASTPAQGYVPNPGRDLHLGSGADLGNTFRLLGDLDDAALWQSAVAPDQLTNHMNNGNAAFAIISYDPLIDLDLEPVMHNIHSGAYIRIPFNLTDASLYDRLTLRLKYDDGFTAYLNGIQVAAHHAPISPQWHDGATGTRADQDAIVFADFNISAHLGLLTNGINALSIHGLNRTANDPDFLILPELIGTQLGSPTATLGYFDPPTPGFINPDVSVLPGPFMQNESHAPVLPLVGDDLTIQVEVTPRLTPIGTVTLHWRVNYGSEQTLAMADNGVAPDTVAGDGIYHVPLSQTTANYMPRDMVRWRFTATDIGGGTNRHPAFLDSTGKSQGAEYFGTVVTDPGLTSGLPIFQWFTDDVPNSVTRTGSRASVLYQGRFYDNVFVRERGQATSTGSQKFDFNKGDPIYMSPKLGSVGEINMNTRGSDATYIRQPLAFQLYEESPTPGSDSYNILMYRNGTYHRVGIFIEQVDEDFLTRHGLDPEGALYKLIQRVNLLPAFNDTLTGVEKKTRKTEDFSDLDEFIAAINTGNATNKKTEVFDRVDLAAFTQYMAAKMIVRDTDSIRKNFYFYRDTNGSGEWSMFPWDEDHSFGNTSPGAFANHIYLGDADHKLACCDQWNVLFDVYHKTPEFAAMYHRRLRSLMDKFIGPPGTPADASFIEQRADQLIALAAPHTGTSSAGIKSWVPSWRNNLYTYFGPGGTEPLLPASQTNSPNIVFGTIEFNPSANQDEEYIELINPDPTNAVDLSNWSITGGVRFTFAPGTVLPGGMSLYVSPNKAAFRSRSVSPKGGECRFVTGNYNGHLSNFGETLGLVDDMGIPIATTNYPGQPSAPQSYLVISEIMYNPTLNQDAEFIEILNTSRSSTIDVSRVHFSAGLEFTFPPGTFLAPEERVVIVKDIPAFQAVYGVGVSIAGVFSNLTRLDNDGESIKLDDATGSTIQSFTYDDMPPWPLPPDGLGPSLTLIAPFTRPNHNRSYNWRSSTIPGGTPGGTDGISFSGDPCADGDGDGLSALLEHALGTGDSNPASGPDALNGLLITNLQAVSYRRNLLAEDVTIEIELSEDLMLWLADPGHTDFMSRNDHGDNTATMTWSLSGLWPLKPRVYARLRVTAY